MATTATIEVLGPLEAVRSALSEVLPGAAPSPTGAPGIFVLDDYSVSTKFDDADQVSLVLVVGDNQDEAAVDVFNLLRPACGYGMRVFAADSEELVTERPAVPSAAGF